METRNHKAERKEREKKEEEQLLCERVQVHLKFTEDVEEESGDKEVSDKELNLDEDDAADASVEGEDCLVSEEVEGGQSSVEGTEESEDVGNDDVVEDLKLDIPIAKIGSNKTSFEETVEDPSLKKLEFATRRERGYFWDGKILMHRRNDLSCCMVP